MWCRKYMGGVVRNAGSTCGCRVDRSFDDIRSPVPPFAKPVKSPAPYSVVILTKKPLGGRLTDELNGAGREVVHRASDFDVSLLFQVFEDWTAAADFGHRQRDIRSRHGVHVIGILA